MSKPFLEPLQLRSALLSFPGTKDKIIDTARIVAAYYLGFPLFVFKRDDARYPSLFLWTQYAQDGLPEDVIILSREEMATILPVEYSPRCPIILLIYCGLELEAILYSDHFNDRRTSLLLRLYIDDQYRLQLTNTYISEFCQTTLPQYITSSMKNWTNLPNTLESFIDSMIELDIVLVEDYMLMLQNFLMEQIEGLFADLPIQTPNPSTLPRVPVYSIPEKIDFTDGDQQVHLQIHMYCRMLLYLLHKSNRLGQELTKAMMIISESKEMKSSRREPFSIVVRLVLIIVAIVFRDSFSLAVSEQWSELPEIALKYKALLSDVSEENNVPFARWYSLATDQDIDHLHLFFEWARETYQQESKLPALSAFTREVWCKNLFERADYQRPESAQNDWISGLIIHTSKVDNDTYDRMLYISSVWKSFAIHDSSLISIRLALTPSDFCSSRPLSKVQYAQRQIASARENRQMSSMIPNDDDDDDDEDRLFTTREDLTTIYAKKGRQMMFRQQLDDKKKKKKKEAKYLKNMHRHELMEMMDKQMELVSEIEKEKRFLASLDASSYSSPSTYSRSVSSVGKPSDNRTDFKDNLYMKGKKEKKLSISSGSLSSASQDIRADSSCKESIDMTSGCELVDLDAPLFNYEEVEAVAEELPQIEKLDFSILSPMPTIRNSTEVSSSTSSSQQHHPKMSSKKLPVPNLPDWMKLLPLEKGNTDRPQLLNVERLFEKNVPIKSLTDRGVQASDINLEIQTSFKQEEKRGNSSRQLNRVNLMTRADISTMLNEISSLI